MYETENSIAQKTENNFTMELLLDTAETIAAKIAVVRAGGAAALLNLGGNICPFLHPCERCPLLCTRAIEGTKKATMGKFIMQPWRDGRWKKLAA